MRRPLLAVGFDFLARAALGLLLASPVVAAVGATGIARFPEGDRLLYEPGGLLLVEVARSLFSAVAPLVQTGVVTGLVAVIALVVPYALLLTTLLSDAPRGALELWGRACTRLPALLSLKGLAFLAQAAACAFTLTAASLTRAAFAGPTTRRADLLAVAVVALGAFVVASVGIVRDLASAACASRSLNGREALGAGLGALRRSPRRVAAGAAWPALLALALVAGAVPLTGALDVSRPGAWRIVAVLGLHQAVVLGLCACRALWLARAVRLVELRL